MFLLILRQTMHSSLAATHRLMTPFNDRAQKKIKKERQDIKLECNHHISVLSQYGGPLLHVTPPGNTTGDV